MSLYVCVCLCVYLSKKIYAIQPLMGCDVKNSINHLYVPISIYLTDDMDNETIFYQMDNETILKK